MPLSGHIYCYRWMPTQRLYAIPVDKIPARCGQAAAIIHMLLNNLDPTVAQFPQELVTYGGNGQVMKMEIIMTMVVMMFVMKGVLKLGPIPPHPPLPGHNGTGP